MAQLNLHHGKGLAITIGAEAEVWEFKTGEAVTAGNWVGFDAGAQTNEDRVTTVRQGDADGLTVGVALETVAINKVVRVCVAGYVEGALTNGTVGAQGDNLIAAADGACAKGAPTSGKPTIGIALESDGSGTTADVYVFRRF